MPSASLKCSYPPYLGPCKPFAEAKLFAHRLPMLCLPTRRSLMAIAAYTSFDDTMQSVRSTNEFSVIAKPTITNICKHIVPQEFLQRAEQLGYIYPTNVQAEALPALLEGQDCILQSQTGSGKTLCYLLAILAKVKKSRAAVQAIVVVPTRELGMQVVREARKLGKINDVEDADNMGINKNNLKIMSLLDGSSFNRQKSWLKADPPQIIVGTLIGIYKMIKTKNLKTNAVNTLVIDEVDAMFGMSEHVALLRTLLTAFTSAQNRQTIFASATVPQHGQFLRKCISEKWVKDNVFHVQVNQIKKMPEALLHRHVVCKKEERLQMLKAILCADMPKAAIIFANEQSEAARRKGQLAATDAVASFLISSFEEKMDIEFRPLVLKEDANINARACTLAEFPGDKNLLIATDLAGRGLDIPEVTHVYNYDLPPTHYAYVHRGGRTARKPFDSLLGTVTTLLTEQELFVYQRYQNEIMFESREFVPLQ